jgi:hypothetical protein
MNGHRPTVVLVILGSALLVMLFLLFWLRPHEPIYQGKTVSMWFDSVRKRQVSWQQFQFAVDEIGASKACPLLFARIRHEDSWCRTVHRTVWPFLPTAFQRRWPVPKALDDNICRTVGLALRSSDPVLVATLALALKDPNSHVRFTALTALKPGKDKIEIVSLAKLLVDPAREIRELAAEYLNEMGAQCRHAMPQLIMALADSNAAVRSIAAGLLGSLGPEAKAAVPALKGLLRDSDWEVRRKSAVALWDIDRETNAITGVIDDAKKAIELGSATIVWAPELTATLNMLNESGAALKPIAPIILNSMEANGEQTPVQAEFQHRVRETMARINPAVVQSPKVR